MINQEIDIRIIEGLLSEPKTIPSRYFYDAKGDELFQQIMELPEYYLTRAEFEILSEQSEAIVAATHFSKETHFDLIELGAGDGSKTRELLKYLLKSGFDFTYKPVDISPNVLEVLAEKLSDLEGLKIDGIAGDYFEVLLELHASSTPKITLFLGSNLGNYEDTQAKDFLQKIANSMNRNDALLIGLDLIKDPARILDAYNDSKGVTKAFNMNLLTRINRELAADFDLSAFDHQPEFAPEGKAISYIVSVKDQVIQIGATGNTISFKKNEKIRTEVSRKYNSEILESMLPADMKIKEVFRDENHDFADYLITKE